MSMFDYIEAKRKERERQIRNEIRMNQVEDASKFVAGTILGALVGVTAGLLFAPQSGEETRREIVDFADDTKDQVLESYYTVKDNIKNKTEEISGDIKDKYDEFKERGYTEIKKPSDFRTDYVEITEDTISDIKDEMSNIKENIEDIIEEKED